jgi:hypothetical protein
MLIIGVSRMQKGFGICFLVILTAACNRRPAVVEVTHGPSSARTQNDRLSENPQTLSPEEAIRRALKAPLPEGRQLAAKAYAQLFNGATETKLRELARSPNPSIALQARWELRHTDHPLPSDVAHPDYIPGFLEGDFGLRVPLAWAVDFAGSWYGKKFDQRILDFYRQAGFRGIGKKQSFLINGKTVWLSTVNLQPELHPTSYGPLAPKNIEVIKEAGKVLILVNNQKVPIRPDFFPQDGVSGAVPDADLNPGKYQVAATIRGDRAFVAVYENDWQPLTLFCLQRDSGRVLWQSTAWADYAEFRPALSGSWYSDVELVSDENRITVFGRGTHSGHYVESFDARTGENELRFSSRYWNCTQDALVEK